MHNGPVLKSLFDTCRWIVLLAALLLPLKAGAEFALKGGETVLLMGDSNTFADYQVQYLEAFLFTRFPGERFHVVNRGVPSETAAGTSEPTHVPPRPNVHDRLEGVLRSVQPRWVIAAYGMNDGIYRSPDPEIFARYRAGIEKLAVAIRESGAELILVTPPPFDARPFAGQPKVTPPDFRRPADDYDSTLQQFSGWLAERFGEKVADIHTTLAGVLESRRRISGSFAFARDGIHLDRTGHMIWALELLEKLGAPKEIARWKIDGRAGEAEKLVPLPMPHDSEWDAECMRLARFDERLNQLPLVFTNDASGGAAITLTMAGSNLRATVEIPAGAGTFDLFPAYARLAAARSREVLKLVQERRRLMLELWVKNESHPRLEGMHQDSRASQAAIDSLEKRIRQAAAPARLKVKMVRPKS